MPALPRLLAKVVGRQTAYDRVTFHGKPMDRATMDALKLVEAELGYELTVLQGIGGAPASGGTHLEGRAVDLAPADHEKKVRALIRRGFAAWYRPARPGVWGAHIHAVLILNSVTNAKGIAAAALRQISSFLRKRDGLVGDGPDTYGYRVSPQPVFAWPQPSKPAPARTGVTRARDRAARIEAFASQGESLLHLSKDPEVIEQARLFAQIEKLAAGILAGPKK